MANSTVFGGIAGEVMARDAAKSGALAEPDKAALADEMERALSPFAERTGSIPTAEDLTVHELRRSLMDAMWNHVGVVRSRDTMEQGMQSLNELKSQLAATRLPQQSLAFNLTWHDWLNLQNLIEVSQIITAAALRRENSRGAHYRQDFPDQGSLEDSYFTVAHKDGGSLSIDTEPVAFTMVKPGESLLDVEGS